MDLLLALRLLLYYLHLLLNRFDRLNLAQELQVVAMLA